MLKDAAAKVKSEYLEGILYLEPSGEIDHHSAKAIREQMDRDLYFYRPNTVILGLSKIGFMDSSGLGLILGRYTKIKDMGGCLKLEDPSAEIQKILRLAGVDRFLEIRFTKDFICKKQPSALRQEKGCDSTYYEEESM